MKRTSPWVGFPHAIHRVRETLVLLALLASMPGVSAAYGYGSYYCAVRYSPYALTYRHSGLVSGCVDYTPYALDYRSSGLVPYCGVSSRECLSYTHPASVGRFTRASHVSFRSSRSFRRHAQDTSQPARPQDGLDVIRQHLTAKGVTTFEINRILRVDDQLVSVDILVRDRNLLVKYWNPEAIQGLSTKEGFKQKVYENYRQDSTRIVAQHEQQGGAVYSVEASDAQTIVAALDSCTKLNPGPEMPNRPVLYARD